MSMITEQIKRLKNEAVLVECTHAYTAKLLREAAETIETMLAKVQAANMERSTAYYNGGWIPVSERLPNDSGEYLVTVIDDKDETYRHIGIAWYAHPKDYDIEEGDWRELMINEKVMAWMPLPGSYKAESEVEDDSN